MRWLSELSNYNFDIKYRPGKISTDCDFLSRHPNFTENVNLFTENMDLSKITATINAIKISNDNNCTMFIPPSETLIQKISIDNSSQPTFTFSTKDIVQSQKLDSIISPVYESVLSGV